MDLEEIEELGKNRTALPELAHFWKNDPDSREECENAIRKLMELLGERWDLNELLKNYDQLNEINPEFGELCKIEILKALDHAYLPSMVGAFDKISGLGEEFFEKCKTRILSEINFWVHANAERILMIASMRIPEFALEDFERTFLKKMEAHFKDQVIDNNGKIIEWSLALFARNVFGAINNTQFSHSFKRRVIEKLLELGKGEIKKVLSEYSKELIRGKGIRRKRYREIFEREALKILEKDELNIDPETDPKTIGSKRLQRNTENFWITTMMGLSNETRAKAGEIVAGKTIETIKTEKLDRNNLIAVLRSRFPDQVHLEAVEKAFQILRSFDLDSFLDEVVKARLSEKVKIKAFEKAFEVYDRFNLTELVKKIINAENIPEKVKIKVIEKFISKEKVNKDSINSVCRIITTIISQNPKFDPVVRKSIQKLEGNLFFERLTRTWVSEHKKLVAKKRAAVSFRFGDVLSSGKIPRPRRKPGNRKSPRHFRRIKRVTV